MALNGLANRAVSSFGLSNLERAQWKRVLERATVHDKRRRLAAWSISQEVKLYCIAHRAMQH